MFNFDHITDGLSRTWESLSQGWKHLIDNTSNALTHFISSDDKQKADKVPSASPHWGLISADMYDSSDSIVIKLEAPGLENDDFDISIVNNVLTISGEKQFEKETIKGEYRILECAYGRFSRSIPLEYGVDAATAKASYNKGVLKITLQKKPNQLRRRIEIK